MPCRHAPLLLNFYRLFMKYFFLLLLFFLDLIAHERYSLRGAFGVATNSDYGQILYGHIEGHTGKPKVYALDGGYLLQKNLFDVPLDLYLHGGVAYFDEGTLGSDIHETTLYVKLYYRFLNETLRFGFGEGASYTSGILFSEYESARSRNDNTSHYLNYLDTSLDFDLGRVSDMEILEKTYIGLVIKHRSGIFGLINNVKKGGSNYNCFYVEKKF